MRAHRLGRAALRDLATVVTPDTLLRWQVAGARAAPTRFFSTRAHPLGERFERGPHTAIVLTVDLPSRRDDHR